MRKNQTALRWNSGEGASAHLRILRAIQTNQFEGTHTPFGTVGSYYDMRGFSIGTIRRINACRFENVDFSEANFEHARIEGSSFSNVVFDRTNLRGLTDSGNRFDRCIFSHATFVGATVGLDGSRFLNCVFDHCNFRPASFVRPEFDRCKFSFCDLNGVDFNGSSFVETTFAGKLTNVWFRGGFAYASELDNFGRPRENAMLHVSLSDAELKWVTFSNHCDLSTVELPTDGKHLLYDRWESRLDEVKRSIESWQESDRLVAANYLRTFQAHAKSQEWYIVNSDEIVEQLGGELGQKLILSLGKPVSHS